MYGHRTLAALLLSAATIGLGIGVGTVSAAPTSPQERVDAAYKAMGLTNAVNTLVAKGRMHTWDPGESEDAYKPETGDFGVSTFTESADLAACRTEVYSMIANGIFVGANVHRTRDRAQSALLRSPIELASRCLGCI